jgi:hypothetical protein
LTLWPPVPASYSDLKSDIPNPYIVRQIRPRHATAQEDLMTLKFPAAKTFALLLAAVAVALTGFAASPADAATKRKTRIEERDAAYGPRGPNVSYQQGPRTRVYISRRSWLDAGVEVLPGDRKFTDYAYPQGQTFGRENLNRPLDRSPLNPPSDFGYGDAYQPRGFPIPSLF